ncbi:MAG: 4-phosphoerythronate dehydrogenase PdxB [Bacteroidales bacterium]|jgi:erythronate-4-phosphate dehydrogenase|nr:4-phosphoerythronate dehydrogenase PdxB [Bacteroidales bacterium]
MKIVIDDKIPFIRGVLEPYAEVIYLPGSVFAHGNISDADALIIRTRTKCNEALLKGTSVKFIATATIGYDHIDTEWCEANGIAWTNAPGCNSGSVRQYIASALATLSSHYGFSFENITLGVVGVGNVGSKVARLGQELGMKVLLNDPPRARIEGPAQFVPLDEIIHMSDIISLHVPLNRTGSDQTFHLFDEAMFTCMRRSTILINSSRGEVVDNAALKNALKIKHLDAVVLDVWENEPDIDTELMSKLNIATPHIAGYSADGKANGTAMSVQALSRFFGLPLTDWKPDDVPEPAQPLHFMLDCYGKASQQCICEAIWHTYSINDDDGRLRVSPGTFEKQRGNYPVRREFEAYTIQLKNEHSGIGEQLVSLGFNLSSEEKKKK